MRLMHPFNFVVQNSLTVGDVLDRHEIRIALRILVRRMLTSQSQLLRTKIAKAIGLEAACTR